MDEKDPWCPNVQAEWRLEGSLSQKKKNKVITMRLTSSGQGSSMRKDRAMDPTASRKASVLRSSNLRDWKDSLGVTCRQDWELGRFLEPCREYGCC